MNSNQANESDGSYHIRVEPKKKLESKLAKVGIPATYCGITALVITLLASQIGVCD